MPHDPLTPSEWDLAHLAETLGHSDPFLVDLLHLADDGLPSGVGIFANGMVFIGALAPFTTAAKEVDQYRHQVAEAARRRGPNEDQDPNLFESALKEFETRATATTEEVLAESNPILDELQQYATDDGIDYRRVPGDLARRAHGDTTRRFLTLEDVQVAVPGHTGLMKLGVVRISLQQIVGWWLIQTDEEGNARFELWPQS